MNHDPRATSRQGSAFQPVCHSERSAESPAARAMSPANVEIPHFLRNDSVQFNLFEAQLGISHGLHDIRYNLLLILPSDS